MHPIRKYWNQYNIFSNPEISLADGMKKYKDGLDLLKEATKMIEDAKLEYTSLQSEDKW